MNQKEKKKKLKESGKDEYEEGGVWWVRFFDAKHPKIEVGIYWGVVMRRKRKDKSLRIKFCDGEEREWTEDDMERIKKLPGQQYF